MEWFKQGKNVVKGVGRVASVIGSAVLLPVKPVLGKWHQENEVKAIKDNIHHQYVQGTRWNIHAGPQKEELLSQFGGEGQPPVEVLVQILEQEYGEKDVAHKLNLKRG